MFYNTPNGLQIDLENGWTISISLAGHDVDAVCEIAVWPTDSSDQSSWVRWGANSVEPPEVDWPIYSRVLSGLIPSELLRVITRLSGMTKGEVEPNRWLSKGLAMESIWR